MIKKFFEKINIYNISLFFLLIGVLWFGYQIRLKTENTDIPLDYDPWWFYRHAKEILENKGPWDLLSYFPPGRPYFVDGYSFSIAFFYKLISNFIKISFEKYCVYFVVFYSLIASFLAFILSYYLTKNLFFSIVSLIVILFSPSFVGVSMAGYIDSDVVYVLFTYLCVLSTLIFLNKIDKLEKFNLKNFIKLLPSIIFLIISYILFAWNWNSAYYISNIFLVFLFFYYIYHLILGYLKNKKFNFINKQLFIFLSFIFILVVIQILSIILDKIFYPYISLPKPFDTFFSQFQLLLKGGLTYALLVNISVAELQKIGIFSKEVIGRVGVFPFFVSFFGMIILIIERIAERKEINLSEFFLIIWFFLSLYLISQGVRFGLLFSISLAIFTSYSLNFFYNSIERIEKNYSKKFKFFDIKEIKYIFLSLTLVAIVIYINSANEIANSVKDMEIDENWRSALDFLKANGNETTLVVTWWDPGHIIAGYAGLKVHADGAHCGWEDCIPYNHDIRIQDAGRILSTENETEAYEILKKYTFISENDCKKVKERFPYFNESICNIKINKIYFIASHDLILKFYWPVYFSSCIRMYYPNTEICYTKEGIEKFFYKKKLAEGKVFIPFYIDYKESSEDRIKYVHYEKFEEEIVEVPIYIIKKNNSFVAFFRNNPVKRLVINGIEYFAKDAGYDKYLNYTVFADPLYTFNNISAVIYLAEEDISNSLFARMFFLDGKDLKFFKLVFKNPEIKIYEIDF